MVTVQVVPVLEQAPLQPAKVLPVSATAVSVTVPLVNEARHVVPRVPQVMYWPKTTVPEPLVVTLST